MFFLNNFYSLTNKIEQFGVLINYKPEFDY